MMLRPFPVLNGPDAVTPRASFRHIDHDYGTGAGIEVCAEAGGGNGEFSIVSLRTLQLGAWRQSRRLATQPWITTAKYPERARQHDDFVTAGELGKQVLVLRALIEDFGGEATGTSLCGRIFGQFPASATETQSGTEIRAVIAQLGKCGALALENMGETDVIARITRNGVILAYDPSAVETGSGAV